MVGPDEGSNYRRLFRNPGYVRVFTAGLGSIAGSAIAGVCLIWIVFARTGSAIDVALLGAVGVIAGIVFSVFGGAWVDRYDRRRLMILSDFVRAAAMSGVVADLELRGFDLPVVLTAYFVLGAFSTIFNPAEQAILPSLVGPDMVADANGLVRSSRSALQFAGTAVGGALIVTVGPTVGVVANAATFLLSGFLLLGMQVAPHLRYASAGLPEYFSDVRAGFRWLWRARGFLELTLSATCFNFCSGIIGTFLVVYSTDVLHGSGLVFASLLAAEVAGVGLGSVLVGPTRGVRWAGRAWVIPYGVVSPIVAFSFILFPSALVAIVGLFGLGLLGGYAGTAWLTAAQLIVPSEMQGRYFGIDNLGSVVIVPVAQIGGAFLIVAWGVQSTFLAAAVLWLAAGVAFLAPRALWNLGYRGGVIPRTGAGATGTTGSRGGTRGG
ncbi:MAG TPA: MFS transporter [Thermoplasmata archaeon]|nr:MFS transporter [Thermoplasmata archaeon]